MSVENELLKASKLKVGKGFSDRQKFLAALVRALAKVEEADFELLSEEAQEWYDDGATAMNKGQELPEIPDTEPVEEAEPDDEDADDEDADEDDGLDLPPSLKRAPAADADKASDDDGADDGDDAVGDDSAEIDANAVAGATDFAEDGNTDDPDEGGDADPDEAVDREAIEAAAELAKAAKKGKGKPTTEDLDEAQFGSVKHKRPGKAKGTAKAKAPAKAAPKAETEPAAPAKAAKPKIPPAKRGGPRIVNNDLVYDKFGVVAGTKASAAAKMYEKGARPKDVGVALEGKFYNVLSQCAERGHIVEKFDDGTIKLTCKEEVSGKRPLKPKPKKGAK